MNMRKPWILEIPTYFLLIQQSGAIEMAVSVSSPEFSDVIYYALVQLKMSI